MTFSISENTLPTVQNLLCKHLQIDQENQDFIQNVADWDELKCKLSALIQHLLQHDFERLLQGMYRIDINEEKFKKVMQIPDLTVIADQLAELILEREIEKAHFRQMYQN